VGSSAPTPTGPKTAGPKTPDRCLACDLLIFDCLCDRGPLVRGIGRQ
jgi:hypothetical protein